MMRANPRTVSIELAALAGVLAGSLATFAPAPAYGATALVQPEVGPPIFSSRHAHRNTGPVPGGTQYGCHSIAPWSDLCVVQTSPTVYVDFWGVKAKDPSGVESYVQSLVQSLAAPGPAGGAVWLSLEAQYGVNEPNDLCPQNNGAPACFWDSPDKVKNEPTTADLTLEADNAAAHFQFPGCDPQGGGCNNINATIVIVTAKGVKPQLQFGNQTFKYPTGFCGYHWFAGDPGNGFPSVPPDGIVWAVIPYIPGTTSAVGPGEKETTCGTNAVNEPFTSNGDLDGVSITTVHEIVEAQTDPVLGFYGSPASYIQLGYILPPTVPGTYGNEVADDCAWLDLQNLYTFGGTNFAGQLIYSNNAVLNAGPPPVMGNCVYN